MSGDALSDLLRAVRLRGAVFYYVEGDPPWVAEAPHVREIIPAIMPGTEPWTLERLGEEAGLSRSSLHERFVRFIGQPPMQYLTQWRMQVASGMLRETNAKLMEVAQCVGYDSEAAFSRAFKRSAGVSPGAWRRGERGRV